MLITGEFPDDRLNLQKRNLTRDERPGTNMRVQRESEIASLLAGIREDSSNNDIEIT